VWGIPAGGTPKLAFSYEVSLGGVGPIDSDPYLRRQFSPDGRQIVVSTEVGLVIVDLASGSSSSVGVLGQFPSWSKDGATVAYVATVSRPDPQVVPYENAIWVVPAAGGTPRELAGVGYSTTAPEWSPDGTLLLAQLKDGVGLIDVASGRALVDGRIPFALATTGTHWRGAGPHPAIVTIVRFNDTQLVEFDVRDRRYGFLAQWPRPDDPSPCRCPKGLVPRDPRWNPTGSDEVVFTLLDESTARSDAMIIDPHSGMTKAVSDVEEVTWSSDGRQLVYIARGSSGGGALRVWDRGSGADRELVPLPAGAPNGTAHLSVASVSY
jgi:WD40 repeat protein